MEDDNTRIYTEMNEENIYANISHNKLNDYEVFSDQKVLN